MREERQRRDLTQAELGQRVGVSDSYVAHMESGVKTPSVNIAMALANALGITGARQDALLAALEDARVQRSTDRIRTRGRAVRGALRSRGATPPVIDVFDPVTGDSLATLTTTPRRIRLLALSPDGRRLAATDDGGTTTVWSPDAPGSGDAHLDFGDVPLTAMAILADGRHILTADETLAVQVRDAESGRLVASFRTESRVTAVASRDGRLALGAEDGRLTMTALHDAGARRTVEAHHGPVRGVLFSPDSRSLISAGQDGFIRYWRDTQSEEARDIVHDGAVLSLAAAPDGSVLASGGADGEIRLWRAKDGVPLRTLYGPGPVVHIGITDGRLVAFYGGGALITWDTKSGEERHTVRMESGPLPPFALSADARRAAVVGTPRRARPDELNAEQIARDLAADPELLAAYRDLRKGLADKDLRPTVLGGLRAWVRNR